MKKKVASKISKEKMFRSSLPNSLVAVQWRGSLGKDSITLQKKGVKALTICTVFWAV